MALKITTFPAVKIVSKSSEFHALNMKKMPYIHNRMRFSDVWRIPNPYFLPDTLAHSLDHTIFDGI